MLIIVLFQWLGSESRTNITFPINFSSSYIAIFQYNAGSKSSYLDYSAGIRSLSNTGFRLTWYTNTSREPSPSYNIIIGI